MQFQPGIVIICGQAHVLLTNVPVMQCLAHDRRYAIILAGQINEWTNSMSEGMWVKTISGKFQTLTFTDSVPLSTALDER